jgi:hypothetical protein
VVASSDEPAWGVADPEGFALGLRVAAGGDYTVAFANRSDQPRQLVVFATLDGKIRTRLVARQGEAVEARPAILPARPVTANIRIVVELAPGQVVERPGAPMQFSLRGDAVLQAVLGGVPGHPAELWSGEVHITL